MKLFTGEVMRKAQAINAVDDFADVLATVTKSQCEAMFKHAKAEATDYANDAGMRQIYKQLTIICDLQLRKF